MNREQERRLYQIRQGLKKDNLDKLMRKRRITEVALRMIEEEIKERESK